MSFGKELLLSCVVVMYISFVACKSFEYVKPQEFMEAIVLPFCNLREAEKEYVKQIFHEDPPADYVSNTLEPLEGITLPVGNTTEEIQASICAIADYLTNHLTTIIRSLTQQDQGDLIENIIAFCIQFKAATRLTSRDLDKCHRNITTLHAYDMKETGLRIICFSRQWVERFTNMTLYCQHT